MVHIELHTVEALRAHLASARTFADVVVQSLDLEPFDDELSAAELDGAIFLGCALGPSLRTRAADKGALVFPRLDNVPFNPYPPTLYTRETLMGAFELGKPESYAETLDARVYEHFVATGRANPSSIKVTLARRLHDFSITDAMNELIDGERVVAIMGGHGLLRTDPMYAAVARIARTLCRAGFLLASGGGPGAMEATHLGAYLAGHDDDALAGALELLAPAPLYKPVPEWLEASFRVVDKYDERGRSLGIPTWLYGHEPPSIFASHIAKYFANSVREDGLLAIAKAGVVFAPGSAGTIQEVFQDACQNHYVTQEIASPMIFFGKDCWLRDKPVYPLLAHLAAGREYALHLACTDDEDEVVKRLTDFSK